ncbi:hypothetical protein [Novilysobacter arseniciresistens]|uniref:hypothetical protein n=1 Tax=Novilysobacter arseniciresistens TaxID=1385522 RepID=UPI001269A95C|nr:hypothetical protein [Lysobacter arseniciresistens]
MLLEKIYLQYEKKRKPIFGSRLSDALGRWFIGTPQSLGMEEIREDLAQSFYMHRVDRIPPEDKEGFKEWQNQSIQATQVRETIRPLVARAAFYSAVVSVMVLIGSSMVVNKITGGETLTNQVVSQAMEASVEPVAAITRENCEMWMEQDMVGTLDPSTLPPGAKNECPKLIQGGN